MIRRDFLRALAAFGTAAAAGGGVAAASSVAAPPPAIERPGPFKARAGGLVYMPAKLDLVVVRGEEFRLDMGIVPDAVVAAHFYAPESQFVRQFFVSHPGPHVTRLELHPSSTAFVRPRSYPWVATNAHGMNVLMGTLRLMPDELWKAEEEVIGIARELYPMGIIEHRLGGYQVGLRERMKKDGESPYANRLSSLLDYTRPTYCRVLNGGDGALITFKPKGLLG